MDQNDSADADTPTANLEGDSGSKNKGDLTPQQSAHNSIISDAKASGADVSDDELLSAKWGDFTKDDNGKLTNVGIICGQLCNLEGAEYGRISADQVARGIMRMNYLSSQKEAAIYTGAVVSPYALYYGGIAANKLKTA